MRFLTLLICIVYLYLPVSGQTYMKLGVTAGPGFAWLDKDSDLKDGFFRVTRTGFSGGICNSLQAGEHFFTKISVLFSSRTFSMRQTSRPEYRTDIQYTLSGIEIPWVAGTSGFLGSLRHREYLGVSVSSRTGLKRRTELKGDSASLLSYNFETGNAKGFFPSVLLGFEVGTTFRNDASLYFGGLIRYGIQQVFSEKVSGNIFQSQNPVYRGAYAGIELHYYLPRYSYWIRKEFTY